MSDRTYFVPLKENLVKKTNLDDPPSLLGVIAWTLGIVIVALVPIWFYLCLRLVLQPTGFWQNVVLIGLGSYFLFGIQLVMLGVGTWVILSLWTNYQNARRSQRRTKEAQSEL